MPGVIVSYDPAYALAQATIDSGQSQLADLSRQATQVSLNQAQAANAAAQSTQDSIQRQKANLNYQATLISLNIAQAVATQKFLMQQTGIARDATTAAQSSAATATQAAYQVAITQTAQAQANLDAQALQTAQAAATLTAYPLTATDAAHAQNVTETVQAQGILNAQATQTAQAMANLTAYPQTATPFAATQAALLMQEYGREQQSFVNQVVNPLMPFIVTFVLLLVILGIILAYRRFMPKPWPRLLPTARAYVNPRPLMMVDVVAIDPAPRLHPAAPLELTPLNPSGPMGENSVHIEIIDAAESPVAQWIAEVEHQLANEGGQSL